MALIQTGAAIALISGKIGGTVYAHNRGGTYARNNAIPTKATSTAATNAKNRLAQASQLWSNLTTAQKTAWKLYSQATPITNRLGNQITLSGHGFFTKLSNIILLAGGTVSADPPTVAAPSPLTTLSGTYDIGAGDFTVVYTATPLAANEVLFVWAAVVDSTGIEYVENLYKLVQVSSAAQTSPLDIETAMTDRFGTLQVGQKVYIKCEVVDDETGLKSQPMATNGTIVST